MSEDKATRWRRMSREQRERYSENSATVEGSRRRSDTDRRRRVPNGCHLRGTFADFV